MHPHFLFSHVHSTYNPLLYAGMYVPFTLDVSKIKYSGNQTEILLVLIRRHTVSVVIGLLVGVTCLS
jgi:hypothetical protein